MRAIDALGIVEKIIFQQFILEFEKIAEHYRELRTGRCNESFPEELEDAFSRAVGIALTSGALANHGVGNYLILADFWDGLDGVKTRIMALSEVYRFVSTFSRTYLCEMPQKRTK